jgi:hypothetical protein
MEFGEFQYQNAMLSEHNELLVQSSSKIFRVTPFLSEFQLDTRMETDCNLIPDRQSWTANIDGTSLSCKIYNNRVLMGDVELLGHYGIISAHLFLAKENYLFVCKSNVLYLIHGRTIKHHLVLYPNYYPALIFFNGLVYLYSIDFRLYIIAIDGTALKILEYCDLIIDRKLLAVNTATIFGAQNKRGILLKNSFRSFHDIFHLLIFQDEKDLGLGLLVRLGRPFEDLNLIVQNDLQNIHLIDMPIGTVAWDILYGHLKYSMELDLCRHVEIVRSTQDSDPRSQLKRMQLINNLSCSLEHHQNPQSPQLLSQLPFDVQSCFFQIVFGTNIGTDVIQDEYLDILCNFATLSHYQAYSIMLPEDKRGNVVPTIYECCLCEEKVEFNDMETGICPNGHRNRIFI